MIDHTKGSFFGRRVGKPLRPARREIFEAVDAALDAALRLLDVDVAVGGAVVDPARLGAPFDGFG